MNKEVFEHTYIQALLLLCCVTHI